MSAARQSVILTGMSGKNIAKHFPYWGEGGPMYFWADKGLIQYEDSRPETPAHKKFGSMSWHDAALRVNALNDMVIKSSEDNRWQFERRRLQKFLTDMEAVIRAAKEFGSPYDDGALEEYRRRKPTSVVVPTMVELD